MKEHYVNYEQAVKLKKLGFDWDVNKVYHRPSTLAEWELFPWHSEYNDWNNEGKFYRSAPTLSLAQKWLRDKWQIHVEPNFIYETKFEVIIKRQKGSIFKRAERQFNSYEEALSFGIDEALNLLTDKSTTNDNKTI